MTFDSIEGILSLIIGVVGIAYGVLADRKRVKVESYLQASIEAISKSLVLIKDRARWAKEHFDHISDDVLSIPDNAILRDAVKRAKDGRSDVTAIGDSHDIIQNQIEVLRTRGNINAHDKK